MFSDMGISTGNVANGIYTVHSLILNTFMFKVFLLITELLNCFTVWW